MKISGLQVDRFGVLNGFQVENVSDGITVFHGANEAGKTTLLQFVRTMFYGFGSDRSQRYLEMQHTSGILASGTRIGGSLFLSARDGEYQVRRFSSFTDAQNTIGELRVTSRDGARVGAHRLNTLLTGVDETIFNNVFAVGLREMQYLGTLNDTQAARYLYNLSTGTDRVSLVDVMRQLNATRSRLLGTSHDPGYLNELAAESDRGRAQIHQLAGATDRWAQMRSELGRLEEEIAQLETHRGHLQRQKRLAELTRRVQPDWEQRIELDARLEPLGPAIDIPMSKRNRLHELKEELEAQHARIEQMVAQRNELQQELDERKAGRESVRNRVRLEALLDQRNAIANLDDRVQRLRRDLEETEFEVQAEHERLKIDDMGKAIFDPSRLETLRGPAREMERDREQLEAAKQEASRCKEAAERAQKELSESLGKNKEWFDESDRRDVAAAIASTEETAAMLRQRVARHNQLNQIEAEAQRLGERQKRQLQNQLLPWEVVRAMGVVFTAGALLLLIALFGESLGVSRPTRTGFTVMGLVLTGFIGLLKMTLDGSSREDLEETAARLKAAENAFHDASQALDQIDAQIPGLKGRTLSLEDVEERLRRLETLIPLDDQRRHTMALAERHEKRAIQLALQLKNARERWSDSLQHLGLSPKLNPAQVWQLIGEAGNLASLSHRHAQLKLQLEQAESELSVFARRIADTVTGLRITTTGGSPTELMVALANFAQAQKQKSAQAKQLQKRSRDLATRYREAHRAGQRLKRQQHSLLASLGVVDEEELQKLIESEKERAALVEQRARLARRITDLCGPELDEDTISQQLYSASGQHLDARIDDIQQQLDQLEEKLKSRLVRQGQLAEQIRGMTQDRELGLAHLNRAVVEHRLTRGVEQLKIVSAMAGMLKHVYKRYEKERQPETLQNASEHFRHMTAGRYLRIWTPLDDDVLMVDDEHGKAISVDRLSRGTREQVFLGLRLALISGYASRGARMPLVLDDVLVNFDQIRTRAAAEVLIEFAQTGGQVLLFTCHQHVADMFRGMGIDVRELPSRAGALSVTSEPDEKEMRVERAAVQKKSKSKRRRPSVRPLIGFEEEEPTGVASDEPFAHREDEAIPVGGGSGIASLYDLQLEGSADAHPHALAAVNTHRPVPSVIPTEETWPEPQDATPGIAFPQGPEHDASFQDHEPEVANASSGDGLTMDGLTEAPWESASGDSPPPSPPSAADSVASPEAEPPAEVEDERADDALAMDELVEDELVEDEPEIDERDEDELEEAEAETDELADEELETDEVEELADGEFEEEAAEGDLEELTEDELAEEAADELEELDYETPEAEEEDDEEEEEEEEEYEYEYIEVDADGEEGIGDDADGEYEYEIVEVEEEEEEGEEEDDET